MQEVSGRSAVYHVVAFLGSGSVFVSVMLTLGSGQFAGILRRLLPASLSVGYGKVGIYRFTVLLSLASHELLPAWLTSD